MLDTTSISILIICVTLFLIVVSVCIAYCVYARIEEGGGHFRKQMRDEYRRLQDQCNSLYKLIYKNQR